MPGGVGEREPRPHQGPELRDAGRVDGSRVAVVLARALPLAEEAHGRVRGMMTLTFAFDVRLIDPAPAARFLQTDKRFVEQPLLWLIDAWRGCPQPEFARGSTRVARLEHRAKALEGNIGRDRVRRRQDEAAAEWPGQDVAAPVDVITDLPGRTGGQELLHVEPALDNVSLPVIVVPILALQQRLELPVPPLRGVLGRVLYLRHSGVSLADRQVESVTCDFLQLRHEHQKRAAHLLPGHPG
jgi:hypothetical protein